MPYFINVQEIEMLCPKCQSTLATQNPDSKFVQCSQCHTVFRVCGTDEDRHVSYCSVTYCPICGKEVSFSPDLGNSTFLSVTPDDPKIEKKWTKPKKLRFKNCTSVFHVLFDVFMIFVSNKGEVAIYAGNNQIEQYSFKLKEKETIQILRYSPKRIVFSTSDHTLYKITINSLFQQGRPERVGEKVDAHYYDIHEDCLAYTRRNDIVIDHLNGETERIEASGRINKIVLGSGYIFYATIDQKIFSYIVRSISSSNFSQKTITFTNSPEKILATSNGKYLAVAVKKGNRILMHAGRWKNLAANASNWDEVETIGSVIDMLAGNEDLLFIQYTARIEVKDMNNLSSGIRNQFREIPDMISGGLYLSLDGNHISISRRDTATTGYNASQIYLLSKSLTEEYAASAKARFIIDSYSWVNGYLAAIINKDGEYQFSLEVINES